MSVQPESKPTSTGIGEFRLCCDPVIIPAAVTDKVETASSGEDLLSALETFLTYFSPKLFADKARYHTLDKDILLLPSLVCLIRTSWRIESPFEAHIGIR